MGCFFLAFAALARHDCGMSVRDPNRRCLLNINTCARRSGCMQLLSYLSMDRAKLCHVMSMDRVTIDPDIVLCNRPLRA
jgi:hypothetical protein